MELTKEKIEELKQKYGKVYKVVISGREYVYRPFTRGEYKEMQKEAAALYEQGSDPSAASDFEDEMVRKCVVYPEGITDIDDQPAGVVPALSTYIAEASGFNLNSEPEEL